MGLDLLMDHGWIQTCGANVEMGVQASLASQAGSGTPVPDLSVEVDATQVALDRVRAAGRPIDTALSRPENPHA